MDAARAMVSTRHIVLSDEAAAALGRCGARVIAGGGLSQEEGAWLLELSVGWAGTVVVAPTRVPSSLAADAEAA